MKKKILNPVDIYIRFNNDYTIKALQLIFGSIILYFLYSKSVFIFVVFFSTLI